MTTSNIAVAAEHVEELLRLEGTVFLAVLQEAYRNMAEEDGDETVMDQWSVIQKLPLSDDRRAIVMKKMIAAQFNRPDLLETIRAEDVAARKREKEKKEEEKGQSAIAKALSSINEKTED